MEDVLLILCGVAIGISLSGLIVAVVRPVADKPHVPNGIQRRGGVP